MFTPPEWMIIYSTFNLAEAHIIAGRLEAEGINAQVHQQAGASAMGITTGAIGEILVLVPANDAANAEILLEQGDLYDADGDSE